MSGGTLRIDASADAGQLVLQVMNDVPASSALPKASMGIGVKNIEQRLRLLYGDKASLHIEHGRGQFTATLHFPLEYAQ